MQNEFSILLEKIEKLDSKIFLLEAKNEELIQKINSLNEELKKDKIGLYEK